LLFGLSGLALITGVAYGIVVSEPAGEVLLLSVALVALVAALAVVLSGVPDRAPFVPPDAPAPDARAATPGAPAWGSTTPLLFAIALGFVAVTAAIDERLVIIAAVLSAMTGFAWFARTWAHHPT